MQAKIADFGWSTPVFEGHDTMSTTTVFGTHGYVDPVVLMNGQPCHENDVYSYGVVLLELNTGRCAIQERVALVSWCNDFLSSSEPVKRHLLPQIVDCRIIPVDKAHEQQLLEVLRIAKCCVAQMKQSWPSMEDVVAALNYASSKDYSNSDSKMSIDIDAGDSPISGESLELPTVYRQRRSLASYEDRENTILVNCTVGSSKIQLRCKIWWKPTFVGLNKVEVSVNGTLVWKKLWWYNAKSKRDFWVGDDIKLRAEWHVVLRTNSHNFGPTDPRRFRSPFCVEYRVEYLAIKDEAGMPLSEYLGGRSPLPPQSDESIESSRGPGPTERRQLSKIAEIKVMKR